MVMTSGTPASIPGAELEIVSYELTDYFYCRTHNEVEPYYVWREGEIVATCEECFLTGAILLGDIGETGHDERMGCEEGDKEAEAGDKELAN